MKSALKRIFGGSTVSSTGNINIKENQYILHHMEKKGKQRYFRQNRGSTSSDKSYRQGGARPRSTNPLNRDGTMSKCAICESIFHWTKDCSVGDKSERVSCIP